jgi:peptidoglycan hydrolase-like protein with peptidoglycan-binding domain
MRKGFVSNEIKELQKRLNKELGLTLVVDGKFGFFTDNAVKDYQRKNALVPDGLVGAKTRAKLNIK